MTTQRAPEINLTGSIALGTIGFDMYLAALGFTRAVLITPKVANVQNTNRIR